MSTSRTARLRRLVPPVAVLALLAGCSLFGGGEEESASGPETSGDTSPERADGTTAWQRAERADVAEGGSLRLAVTAQPATFNPLSRAAFGTDVERLLAPTTGSAMRPGENGEPEVDPDYARSVEVIGQDPLTVRVELNPDAVWQAGTPITSADMRAFVEVMTDPAADVQSRDGWDDVAAVRADGDDAYEVEFETSRSDWAAFVYPRTPASVSRDVKAFNERFTERPLPSNGPFVITDVDAETGTITQERNPRWWGETPRLESLTWRVATAPVQAEAFAAGELDVAVLDASGLEQVEADRVQRASGSQWSHLTLNAGRGPLRDVLVRRAVTLALDRPALAAAVSEPLGAEPRTVDSLVRVPGQAGYDEVAEPYERDVDRARELLADAGYDLDGDRATRDGEPLELSLAIAADAPQLTARAEAVADQLAEAGIGVEIREVAADDYVADVLVPLDFDLLTFSWAATPFGPDGTEGRFRPVTSPVNFTGVSMSADPWRAVTADSDVGALAALGEVLRSRAVMVPLALAPQVAAVREGVVNVGASSFETPDWTAVGALAD